MKILKKRPLHVFAVCIQFRMGTMMAQLTPKNVGLIEIHLLLSVCCSVAEVVEYLRPGRLFPLNCENSALKYYGTNLQANGK